MKVKSDHLGKSYPDEKAMCDAYGIAHTTFYQRYHVNNWTLEDALTLPVRPKKYRKREEKETSIKKEKNILKTEIKEFSIESNYPQKEYVKYLKNEILNLKSSKNNIKDSYVLKLIDEKISRIDSLVQEILADSFHYNVMDMIFAGEKELAKEMCSQDTFQYCSFLLDNPSGTMKDIYITFANKFNMQRKNGIK